jgi:Tol biopolymer transport system component
VPTTERNATPGSGAAGPSIAHESFGRRGEEHETRSRNNYELCSTEMRYRIVVTSLWLAACGRFRFDPLAAGGDAADDTVVDAACVLGPWSAPVQLVTLGSPASELGPSLSFDGLQIVFSSDRSGSTALYLATRPSPSDAFGAPVLLAATTPAGGISSPTFSSDGLTLYFNAMTGADKATRATTSDLFGAPVTATELSNLGGDGMTFSTDGTEVFFGFPSISRGTRPDTASNFVAAGTVSELGQGGYPALSGDSLTIYFVTTRDVTLEIYSATRPAVGAPFGTPAIVPELSADGDSDDPSISGDGRAIVFRSTRVANDSGELFMSTRACQ